MRGAELHAKLTLVQQLKQLSKQHEQVLQAYERKVEEKLAEVARQGAGGATKRMGAPLHAEGPEAKRQRQLIDRDNRRKIIWVGAAAATVLRALQPGSVLLHGQHGHSTSRCCQAWACSTPLPGLPAAAAALQPALRSLVCTVPLPALTCSARMQCVPPPLAAYTAATVVSMWQRYQDEIIKLVEKIRKNPKSEAFRSPVDPVKLKIPDYPNIIHL